MSKMFTGTGRMLQEVQSVPLDEDGLLDIERRVKVQPHFLGEPLVVIGEAEDFPQVMAPRSHNLVALDAQGRTMIICLRMGVADTGVDLHGLQSAAHVATMTAQDLGKVALAFVSRSGNDSLRRQWEEMGVEMSEEAVELSSLLAATFERDAEDYADLINQEQRIILACEEFTSRLVSLVQWMSRRGVSLTALRYRKYLVGGQEVYFAEQIVPRTDPAVDAPERDLAVRPVEGTEPWRTRGRTYHIERLTPALGNILDRILVATRPSTFSISWSHQYYFWMRGPRRNLRVRTYFRDRIEIGFYNTAPGAVRGFLDRYGIHDEVVMVGGYSESPFVAITPETDFDDRWIRMLNDWLSGDELE